MAYNQRWHAIAHDWLADSDVPDRLVKKYTAKLAQQLQDTAEDFVNSDLPDMERDAEQAAEDRHWQQKIDEARGK